MRVALVVSSAYEKNAKLTAIPSAEVDTDLMVRRLSAADAGFKVLRFEAERGLAERIEQRLLAQTDFIQELLVYFSGYSVLSEERGPALLLDGERLGTFSLKRLRNLFQHFARSSCLIVDAAAVMDGDQGLPIIADAIGRTLTDDAPGIEALVAVRGSEAPDSFGGSAFTGMLLTALDWLGSGRAASEAIDLRQLFDAVRSDEQLFNDIPAAGLFGGEGTRLQILPAQTASARPAGLPSFESQSSEGALPSFESQSSEGALPSFEGPADRESATAASTATSNESALPSFDDVTPAKASLLEREDSELSGASGLPKPGTTEDSRRAGPSSSEEPSPSGSMPRFDDTTSPQMSLPRFDEITSPHSVLPRFEDQHATDSALPRFDDTTSPQSMIPRFEESGATPSALPTFEETTSPESLLPRFEDRTSPESKLPRFDDAAEALPRFEDAFDALPSFEPTSSPSAAEVAALRAAASPLPQFDPVSHASSIPLPRFEIPGGPPTDLDALLGLGLRSADTEVPPIRDAALPTLDEGEPKTEPGLRPFESDDVTATTRPEPARGSLPSFTTQSSAEELVDSGRIEDAVTEYEAALALCDEPYQRAGLLAGAARALAKLGRAEQAAQRFSEASALDSSHPDVLWVRAEWAEAALDFENLLHTVEAWLAARPGDPRPLGFFARAAEGLGDARKAFETWVNLGNDTRLAPRARAEALSNASRLAETKLGDGENAQNLAGLALSLAPDESALRERATRLFTKSTEPERLFSHFESALAATHDAETLSQLVDAVETHARTIDRPAAAARALEAIAARYPSNLSLRDRMTELYAAAQSPREALLHCRAAARLLPTRASTYRRAQTLFHAAQVLDGAWNAASVLECLGEADINEALFASQHRPEGLLAARNMIAAAEWPSGLLVEVRDVELEAVLAALDTAAVRVGIGFSKYKNRYVELDPALREDPDRSTTMLAKTLGWTSRLLGLTPPSLYILPELEPNLDVAPSEEPGALVSRALGSGLGLGQLAFLWGRHLPRFRSELRALSFFRGRGELACLLRAALALGGVAGIDVRELEGDAKRLHAALRREVRGSALEHLERVARRLPVQEIEQRANLALRGLELAGVRAGLLACGDVAAAAELLRRFPEAQVTDMDEQLGELYAFSISEAYEGLRVRIGVALAA